MGTILRQHHEQLYITIDHEASLKKFYEYAEILHNDLHVPFLQKLDDFDNLIWEFRFEGYFLVLQFDSYAGISIRPSPWIDLNSKEKKELPAMILSLESLLLNHLRLY